MQIREWADFHREIQIQIQIKIQIQMKILFRANTNLSTRSFESLCANEVVTKVEFLTIFTEMQIQILTNMHANAI